MWRRRGRPNVPLVLLLQGFPEVSVPLTARVLARGCAVTSPSPNAQQPVFSGYLGGQCCSWQRSAGVKSIRACDLQCPPQKQLKRIDLSVHPISIRRRFESVAPNVRRLLTQFLRNEKMRWKLAASLCMVGVVSATLLVALAVCEDTPGAAAATARGDGAKAGTGEADDTHVPVPRVPVAVARERAELMHRIYAATLDMLHHRYFHDSRAMVPARAMEDVFAEMATQSQVEAHWIAVNMRAMSLSHEPKNEFEKAAAQEIADGKETYELVENGYYRRAGAIPLASGCANCHGGFFKEPPKTPRFAALVISVPVRETEGASLDKPAK